MSRASPLRRAWVHAILLAGCLVFAFPFFWLVTSSFKRNEELAVFPPKWVPEVPWNSEQSPFIDGGAYGDMKAPEPLSRATWERLRPTIEEILWTDAQARLGATRLKAISGMADADHFRPQMIAGLWSQARELVPDHVWKQSQAAASAAPADDPLVKFLGGTVSADMVAKVSANVLRALAVGHVVMRHISNDVVAAESDSGWQVTGPASLSPAELEGEKGQLVSYDFSKGDAFSLVRTMRLPVALDKLQAINIPIHCDASWHRAILTLETGGRVYRAERPFWVDIRTWQEAEFTFHQPLYLGSRSIVLEPDDQATDVSDPGDYRLTWTVEKSGRWRGGLDKYIDSYRWALRYIPFDKQLQNTLILVILNVAGQLFACSLVAYAFARMKFYGRDVLFGLLLATMMLPGQVTMIPQFVLWKTLGWYDTLRPLWVPAWFGGAFFIFLLRQFFMTIPRELEDAAKIDGCGFFGIYWRIMLPLAGPAMATVAIFAFMGAWNEFVGPLVYLSDERLFPLSLGLNQFRQENAAEFPMLMAASTLMMLPVIAVFFFCQRYFIQGVTLTGIKG